MRFCLLAMLLVCMACSCGFGQESTWVEVDGVVYGAKADDRGPMGGGAGYAKTIAKGDYVVTDLDGLLAALSKAKAGEVV